MFWVGFGLLSVCMATTVVRAQTLHSDCGCYGTASNYITANCSNTEQIAINRLFYGTKTNASGCPRETTSLNIVDDCCAFNATTDCVFDIQEEHESGYSYQVECIGKSNCTIQVTRVVMPDACSAVDSYLEESNFMCLEYYCINRNDIAPICNDTNAVYSDKSTLYISNNQYIDAMTQSNCCNCRISTNVSGSTINVTSIDFRLNETAVCEQSLIMQDGAELLYFECDRRNKLWFKHLYTTMGNAVDIYLNYTGEQYGYMWLELSSPDNVTVLCTDTSVTCPTSPLTTTETPGPKNTSTPSVPVTPTTPGTPGPTAASTAGDDCFVKSGLPVLIALLAVCVAAVASSVFCYKRGQRSALNRVTDNSGTPVTPINTDNSLRHRGLSLPLDHSLPPLNTKFGHLPPIGASSSNA